jgi:ubiquinone/menaquinone biosynthesis C-methylase UbiE
MRDADVAYGSAGRGRAFDAVPRLYDAVRPGYPDEAVDWALRGQRGTVVDLGAGTGVLTAQLVRRGLDVIAVDPSVSMLDVLRERLSGVRILVGTAESTGLSSGVADAIVVGAAFHWFARPAADKEMARVLADGGSATLLWNPIDPDSALGSITARIRSRLGLGGPEYDPDVVLDNRWFGPSERAEFRFTRTATVEEFLAQLASRSYLAGAPEQVREALLQLARREAADLVGVDGIMRIPYKVTAIRAAVLR